MEFLKNRKFKWTNKKSEFQPLLVQSTIKFKANPSTHTVDLDGNDPNNNHSIYENCNDYDSNLFINCNI